MGIFHRPKGIFMLEQTIELSEYRRQRQHRMAELGVRLLSIEDGVNVDFSELSQASIREPNVLNTPVVEFERSFNQGMSSVLMQGNKAVGHTRFIPLLDRSLINDLGLGEEFPEIWEMGTGLMLDPVQGRGLNNVLRFHLYDRYVERMRSGEVLVIGTTKTPELTGVLDRLRLEYFNDSITEQTTYPLDFRFCNRETLPFVAPTTCVCNPTFGSGYHIGDFCSNATTIEKGFRTGAGIPLKISIGSKPKIDCTMFLSSSSLAVKANTMIGENPRYSTRQSFVQALVERGYYE